MGYSATSSSLSFNRPHPCPPITKEKKEYFDQLKVINHNESNVVDSVEDGTEKKSNEYVLNFAFVSFLSFLLIKQSLPFKQRVNP